MSSGGGSGYSHRDWQQDSRNPNWDSKRVTRPDGSYYEMYRHHGQKKEDPHVTQEFDKRGNTDVTRDVHKR
jgi:hypothetical protein